jgi:hypothetical protein
MPHRIHCAGHSGGIRSKKTLSYGMQADRWDAIVSLIIVLIEWDKRLEINNSHLTFYWKSGTIVFSVLRCVLVIVWYEYILYTGITLDTLVFIESQH